MTSAAANDRILTAGRNCWRQAHAGRVAFLVDGAAYFAALRAAAVRARRSIFIIGWDLDSRMQLLPEGADDGLPEALGDFLNALVKRRRALHVYLLNWDFIMLYASDREAMPRYKLAWRTHRRVHFELDGAHPVGGSHHQKVVVIDDAMAFVGGLDLTHCRWDTPEHRAEDPRRDHPAGDSCPPFHDIQMAVDGDAAAALGELARERWRRATGKTLASGSCTGADSPWPSSLEPDLTDVTVAISRTEPHYEEYPEVQEIKQLYLDAIAATRGQLYLENQYFSAASLARALKQRLAEPRGPEIVIVSRSNESGWLETATVGVMRARLHQQLCEAAPDGRYANLYPRIPGPDDGFLNVHSKLLIMDDELVTIGSANLNNRSMGFDTECNLTIEAGGDECIASAIRGLRHRLLAEHLGTDAQHVATTERETGSLLATIAALRGNERSLEPLELELSDDLDDWVPDGEILDPERPVEPEKLAARLTAVETSTSGVARMVATAGLLAAVLVLAAAWRWSDIGEWIEPDKLSGLVVLIEELPYTPLVVLTAFVIGSLLVVPVTAMIAAVVVVFGSGLGAFYAASGSLLGAAATYAVGHLLGRDTLRRMTGSRLDRLSRELGRRGVLTIVTVRIIPVAPFSIVNLVAGATHISFRDFMLGTAIGLAPGIIAIALFIDRIRAAIREPGAGSVAILVTVLAALIVGFFVIRRTLRRRRSTRVPGG
ncbi:MAG: VTT domain-containing protein [Gammaproteobacteria bacterium]